MNGDKRALLDSNFIIFISQNKIDITKLRAKYDAFFASIVTYMEVYAFDFKDEAEKLLTDQLFQNLEVIEINKEIADLAISYRKNKDKKIKLPDAIILATAKYLDADLLTEDLSDFRQLDRSVDIVGITDLDCL